MNVLENLLPEPKNELSRRTVRSTNRSTRITKLNALVGATAKPSPRPATTRPSACGALRRAKWSTRSRIIPRRWRPWPGRPAAKRWHRPSMPVAVRCAITSPRTANWAIFNYKPGFMTAPASPARTAARRSRSRRPASVPPFTAQRARSRKPPHLSPAGFCRYPYDSFFTIDCHVHRSRLRIRTLQQLAQ